MSAFSAAAFLSSMTAMGRPLRKRMMSGRRLAFSWMVNWLMASQSLLLGWWKSISQAWSWTVRSPSW